MYSGTIIQGMVTKDLWIILLIWIIGNFGQWLFIDGHSGHYIRWLTSSRDSLTQDLMRDMHVWEWQCWLNLMSVHPLIYLNSVIYGQPVATSFPPAISFRLNLHLDSLWLRRNYAWWLTKRLVHFSLMTSFLFPILAALVRVSPDRWPQVKVDFIHCR